MLFHGFHLFHYVIDAIPVGIKHVRPEIRLIERREEVLRHRPHDNQRSNKEHYHRTQCQCFPANQRAEDGGEFVIERFVIRVFRAVLCFRFQDEITENSGLRQREHPAQSQRDGKHHKKRFHDFRHGRRSKVEREERTDSDERSPKQSPLRTGCSVYQRFPPVYSAGDGNLCVVCHHDGVIHQHPHGDDKSRQRSTVQPDTEERHDK